MMVVGSESLSLLLRLLRRLLRLRRTKEEAKTTRDKHGCGNGRLKEEEEEEENISDINHMCRVLSVPTNKASITLQNHSSISLFI